MTTKNTTNWLLGSLTMAITAAAAVMLLLKAAAAFWFQSMLMGF